MQDFEYALKRKAAVREDYLRYIGALVVQKGFAIVVLDASRGRARCLISLGSSHSLH